MLFEYEKHGALDSKESTRDEINESHTYLGVKVDDQISVYSLQYFF